MKKGFTLVELVAVIIILGVLGLIAVVTISNTIKTNEENAYNLQINYIKEGAKNWAGKHVFELPDKEGEYLILTLLQLKQEGCVDDEIKNPKTNALFDDNLEIKIIKQNGDYVYEVME